jgi:iron(III) transport system ATP-binding protein
MVALSINGLSKSFGQAPVLDALDLEIEQGSLVAILGASGGGKTTLLRLICGFERADRGSIAIAGAAMDAPLGNGGRRLHVRPERRRIGYVAQDGALFPHLPVGANILFGLDRAGRRDAARAEALLDLVGLPTAYASRLPQTLSGGEQQRVALARALAPAPRLVLLDEPFSALDASLRTGTRQAVAEALARAGATALLVTHDQSEALSMGDRVGVLREGRLVQLAAPAELYRRPIDADLARFVGEAVLLDGLADGACVACALGRLALAHAVAPGPVEVMIRPEQIRLRPDGAGCPASVETIAYYGHDAGLTLRLGDGARVAARIDGATALGLAAGAAIGLEVQGAVVAFPVADRHSNPIAGPPPCP